MQLEDNLTDFQEALNYFIVDIKLNKTSVVNMSHFERHFGKKKTEDILSLTVDNPRLKADLDKKHLVREALNAEEQREPYDSHRRFQFVQKGENSRDLRPQFKTKSSSIANITQYKVLESLAQPVSDWMVQKQHFRKTRQRSLTPYQIGMRY